MAYTAKDIEVLEGLEPVRKRPAMYIGDTDVRGYHHLLWEIVDNSVDEAINGHANLIEVTLDADHKGATITDNGRGIPVDIHPKYKRSALELVLCTLHAGGKFEGKNYQVSGGLHGVGSSVVNALSDTLTATIRREGEEYVQTFERGVPMVRNKAPAGAKAADPAVLFFTCDGRSTCKQMTSCEEARYFIKTCPGFNAGVFGEEASCEKQWCHK